MHVTRPIDIDERIEEYVNDLIKRFAKKRNGEWSLDGSIIERYGEELGRLWFEKNNFNYEFLIASPWNNPLTTALLSYFRGVSPRDEAREDVCNSIDMLLYKHYVGDITRYIEDKLEEKNERDLERAGFSKRRCSETGCVEWI